MATPLVNAYEAQRRPLEYRDELRRGSRRLRTGAESDALIAALRELYGMPPQPVRMADITPFVGIALHFDDGGAETETMRIKLLAHDREVQAVDRSTYHESLFTLDLPSRLALWQEKDHYYRAPLIRGISSA